jgi:hypothetical protein
MTDVEREELRRLSEAATPGPWEWFGDVLRTVADVAAIKRAIKGQDFVSDGYWEAIAEPIIETDGGFYAPRPPDRALIVAMRNGIGKLLDELDARDKEIERLTAETEWMRETLELIAGGYASAGEIAAQTLGGLDSIKFAFPNSEAKS